VSFVKSTNWKVMIHYWLSLLNLESMILCNWIDNMNAKPLLCDMDIQHGRNTSKVERWRRKRKCMGKQRTNCLHFHSFPSILQTEKLLLFHISASYNTKTEVTGKQCWVWRQYKICNFPIPFCIYFIELQKQC